MKLPTLLPFLLLSACSVASWPCGAETCQSGFYVQLPLDGWQRGAWRFEITADGVQTVCETGVPSRSFESARCSPSAGARVVGQILEDDTTTPYRIEFGTTLPRTESVRAYRDDSLRASGDWTPSYETLEPNGPRCPPVCRVAHVDFEVF